MNSRKSCLEVLLDENDFRSFLRALELRDVLLPLLLNVTVLVLRNQFCVPLFDPPSRVSPYLFDHFQHVWVSKRNVFCGFVAGHGFPRIR